MPDKAIEEAARIAGVEIVKPLKSVSAKDVYLTKRGNHFLVLKWPEERYKEREALQILSPNLAPKIEETEGGGFLLEYLQGRRPFFWNEGDYRPLLSLFRQMEKIPPPDNFPTLSEHLERLEDEYPGLSFPKKLVQKKDNLIHGELHPWNIFLYDGQARVIDPYGLKGDVGFDIAFLAATLANNQEEFLQRIVEDTGIITAKKWFPSLVLYRLENARRQDNSTAKRILTNLAERVI